MIETPGVCDISSNVGSFFSLEFMSVGRHKKIPTFKPSHVTPVFLFFFLSCFLIFHGSYHDIDINGDDDVFVSFHTNNQHFTKMKIFIRDNWIKSKSHGINPAAFIGFNLYERRKKNHFKMSWHRRLNVCSVALDCPLYYNYRRRNCNPTSGHLIRCLVRSSIEFFHWLFSWPSFGSLSWIRYLFKYQQVRSMEQC